MRMTRVRISNYRSIREMTIECSPHLVLVGPNNHGKSNVLAAIEFALSSSKPDSSDFFRCDDDCPCDLWVEITFGELTDQELTTFKKYVRRDRSFTVRKESRRNGDAMDVAYHGYLQDPDEWWLKSSSIEELSTKDKLRELAPSTPELQPLLDKSGRVTKGEVEAVQDEYIATHGDQITFEERLETGHFLGAKNIAAGVLPEFYLIPAVRDLSDETKIKAGTSLGRLVQRAVKEMAENDPKLAEAQKQLDGAVTSLCPPRNDPSRANTALGQLETQVSRELQDWGCSVFIDVQPPSVDRLFELGTELRLDDGVETLAEAKGHGLQRATLFALIRVWARVLHVAACEGGPTPRKASESLVFAVEEPELFLHPHAQRQFDAALRELAEDAGHQVLLVTHSTHFVNLDYYKEICIISREDAANGSRVRQCTEDLFEGGDRKSEKTRFHMAVWVDPNRAEMFFARRVVLVEGETEKTVLPYLAERLKVLDPSTSVIDCAGKHNLPLYMEVCKAFDLDYYVVHDEDPVPPDCKGDELQSKTRTYALNQTISESCGGGERIYMFRPDIEKACGISRSQADKRGKGLAALAHFNELSDADIPKVAIDCTHLAYRGAPGPNDSGGQAE